MKVAQIKMEGVYMDLTLKSRLVLGTVLFVLFGSIYGQSDQTKKPEAYKFAEFRKISSSELGKRIDGFCRELRKTKDLQGYVINYGSPIKIKARRGEILKYFRPCVSDYDPTRVTFVDGPEEPEIRTVLWMVPPGADNPQP